MMNSKPIKNKVTDIDLSITDKKPFRFGKDDNRIVYINTADMGIINRAEEIMPKIQDALADYFKGAETESSEEDSVSNFIERTKEVDEKIRVFIDELFDAPVSAAAAPTGSMVDIFNGSFRYEFIIEIVGNQYMDNLNTELKKMETKLKQHTKKYTKGKK